MNTINMNIFKEATQRKFRYPYKGWITTEDLWDLNREQLDTVFKALNKETYDKQVTSLLSTEKVEDLELLLKIEVVKFIFNVKEKEVSERLRAAEVSAKKQRIMDILAKKQEDSLQNMSEEDLVKMLDELK